MIPLQREGPMGRVRVRVTFSGISIQFVEGLFHSCSSEEFFHTHKINQWAQIIILPLTPNTYFVIMDQLLS